MPLPLQTCAPWVRRSTPRYTTLAYSYANAVRILGVKWPLFAVPITAPKVAVYSLVKQPVVVQTHWFNKVCCCTVINSVKP